MGARHEPQGRPNAIRAVRSTQHAGCPSEPLGRSQGELRSAQHGFGPMSRSSKVAGSRVQAWGWLWARYAAVFGTAWRHRQQVQEPERNADELAFLPAALSSQHTPVHPAPRRLGYLLIALLFLAVGWACLGQVDIVAVAPGRIIVGDRTKTIQSLERSVVKWVLVQDGDHVAQDQPVVELDPTIAAADKHSVRERIVSSQSEVARSRGLLKALDTAQDHVVPVPALIVFPVSSFAEGLSAQPDEYVAAQNQMTTEWRDIQARVARWDAELVRRRAELTTAREVFVKIESTLPLVRQREQDFAALAAQGVVAHHTGQDRTRERLEMECDLQTQGARLHESEAALLESERSLQSYVVETRRLLSDRLAQAELRQLQANQEYAKALQRERLTVLTSPVAGVVQQLAANTSGGVVTEAQVLMVIVPDDSADSPMVAEVVLENNYIGFVSPGQQAQIKRETFVFTRYGTVPATVKHVMADAVNDDKRGAIFPARLQRGTNRIDVDGKKIRLSPGMNVTAEIKTGQRRVIEYLLSPIQKVVGESMRER